MQELPTTYDHKSAEERVYRLWEESGFFNPDKLPGEREEPFTIIMPPPNANGPLHVGHALFVTIEDIMIRYARMRGKKTLWLPGADHAGFETQVVYNKKLEKEGKKFWEIPREELYGQILEFTLANKKLMESQLRSLGASCDWSREKFTLDENIKKIVHETFEKLYKDGLVYRGERIINWCPKHQTSLSDLEIEQPEISDTFYYLKYGPFVIATARPETKFGDKYVVMHPDDKRYKQYKNGQKFEAEWINGPIMATVIKDKAIDPKFGTGVMTITPWHDAVDFEIAERHKLDKVQIIDWQGKLLPIAGEFSGQHISKARPLIVEKLKQKGLLVKSEPYKHAVPVCYKCHTPIEPQIRAQWFVAMTKKPKLGNKSLRDLAVNAVKTGKVKFVTKKFEKIFLHWMKNLRDWNVSRQIVWGIQIPAWFCKTKQENNFVISIEKPKQCSICGQCDMERDPDVFDTWFSSGQWPFATLMAGKSEKDFSEFYPTNVMETGHDILFFWVARMIMLGIYRTGKAPFKTVYLHGLVRDKERQKMSKSKGNVIDPLGIAETYGADALRMALVVGATAGNDPILSEDKVRGYRNFATKIWNVGRFVLMNYKESPTKVRLNKEDKKNLAELKMIKKKVASYLDKYDFHHAAETSYHYFWHTFADKIIENSKHRLASQNENDRLAAQTALLTILGECLKMLHPFMPFITEEIYQLLPIENKNLLMVTQL